MTITANTTATLPNGTYEVMMKKNTKQDMGIALHDLLSDHFPQAYAGLFGKPQKYCPTCETSTEQTGEAEACGVMATLADHLKM